MKCFKIFNFSTKIFSFLLAVALLMTGGALSFFVTSAKTTAVAGAVDGRYAVLSAHCNYTISLRNAVYDNSPDRSTILTDTQYSSVSVENGTIDHSGWVAVKSYNGNTDFTVTVVMDMGYTANGMSLFFSRIFHCEDINVTAPDKIEFFCSNDGNSYTALGAGSTTTDLSAGMTSAVYSLELDNGVCGRYVKMVYYCSGDKALYINECGAAAKGIIFESNSDSADSFVDGQGIKYTRKGNGYSVSGTAKSTGYTGGSIVASDASFNQDGLTYTLGNGSDNEVTVISDFISESRVNYSGVPNNIRYIVIHNTGTVEEETDAERYNKRMHTINEEKSWHYTVDSKIIYHSLNDDIAGWHSGSTHNYQSLGIEICTNGAPVTSAGKFVFSGTAYEAWLNSTFRPALKNAAMLTAELLTRYGLGTDAVIQHYDVTEKNCPLWLRYKDGRYTDDGYLWVEFMGYVEKYYKLINGTSPAPTVKVGKNIVIPDYVKVCGKYYPVTSIESNVFAGRTGSARTLALGQNISHIDLNAFDGCGRLKITVDEGNRYYSSDENGIIYNSGGSVIFDAFAVSSATPSPAENSGLDIRSIDGYHYLFCDNIPLSLQTVAEKYGSDSFSGKRSDGTVLENTHIVGTGDLLTFGKVKIYVVALGDMNGDKSIDVFDYHMLKTSFFERYCPSKAQLLSVDFSSSGALSTFDYLTLKSHVLGKHNIFQ